jgi:hypothetical protein
MFFYIIYNVHFFILEHDETQSIKSLLSSLTLRYNSSFNSDIRIVYCHINTFSIDISQKITDILEVGDRIVCSIQNNKEPMYIYTQNPNQNDFLFLLEGCSAPTFDFTRNEKEENNKNCYVCKKELLKGEFKTHLQKHIEKPYFW